MKQKIRRGIAMIELIFALVIMGIVLLSAPMLIQQSIQSSNVALQQESITAIASYTGILLSKHWDENNTQHVSGVSPILKLTAEMPGTDFNFSGVDFDNNVSGRTTDVSNVTFNASALVNDGDFDDIDDYNGFPITLAVFLAENSAAGVLGDYIDTTITIATTVSYADDRPTGDFNLSSITAGNSIFGRSSLAPNIQSNIKFVQTVLTSTSGVSQLDKNITLRAFSCNLGTYYLNEEQY